MIRPTRAFSIDSEGRVRINQAAPAIAHARISVDIPEVELTAGLGGRRKLYIKPVRTGSDPNRFRRWVFVGPSGVDDNGTPVFEEFELVLDVGAAVRVFAIRGDDQEAPIDVRVLELGEA